MKDIVYEDLYTVVCICSRTSRRPNALQDIIDILCTVCMPTEELKRLQLCIDAMSQSRGVPYEILQYIVLVCSWTSQRVKLCKDIMNMLHTAYVPTECKMASPLQRCNGSMKDVLYEDLYSVHMLLDQPKAQSLPKI